MDTDPKVELDHLRDELADLADDADDLHASLARPYIPWFELRDLLEREFQVNLGRPGARLWLDTIVDDIVGLLLDQHEDAAQSLAIGLRRLTLDEYERDESSSLVLCGDCGVNTIEIGEYYALRDPVWAETGMEPDGGMLCIGCVEMRLRRRLTPDDFAPASVNLMGSERLRSRVLGREASAT
jgi:hypothetical protein